MAIIIGKGFRDASNNGLYIFGYHLPNTLSQDIYSILPDFPYTIIDERSTYDLSNLTMNNEVSALLWSNDVTISSGTQAKVEWYRGRDNRKLFTLEHYIDPGEGSFAAGTYQVFSWLGYTILMRTPSHIYDEITENGSYYTKVVLTGGVNTTETINYEIIGIPVSNTIESAVISGDYAIIKASAWGGNGIHYVNFYNSDLGRTIKQYTDTDTYPYTAIFNISTLLAGDYTFSARAYALDGTPASSPDYVTVTITIGRPANWLWTTANDANGNKISGADYRMGNNEWNNFTSRINEFLVYKNFGTTTFTQASFGNTFTATMFNQAKNAIGGMNATGIVDKVKDDNVLASYFNTLKTKLNEL